MLLTAFILHPLIVLKKTFRFGGQAMPPNIEQQRQQKLASATSAMK
jgi:hypothetical protein